MADQWQKLVTVIVDTNVLVVANGGHEHASPECQLACVMKIEELTLTGLVVLDDCDRILQQYRDNTQPFGQRRVADEFVKWLMQNQYTSARVSRVTITELPDQMYAEFPDQVLQPDFDASDRMFPAVSNAHPAKPPILQAVDSKWVWWWERLSQSGVEVKFVCPSDIVCFFKRKFPEAEMPPLPGR